MARSLLATLLQIIVGSADSSLPPNSSSEFQAAEFFANPAQATNQSFSGLGTRDCLLVFPQVAASSSSCFRSNFRTASCNSCSLGAGMSAPPAIASTIVLRSGKKAVRGSAYAGWGVKQTFQSPNGTAKSPVSAEQKYISSSLPRTVKMDSIMAAS